MTSLTRITNSLTPNTNSSLCKQYSVCHL